MFLELFQARPMVHQPLEAVQRLAASTGSVMVLWQGPHAHVQMTTLRLVGATAA